MDESREAGALGSKLDEAWARRVKEAEEWNARLESGDLRPSSLTRLTWSMKSLRGGRGYREKIAALEKRWREKDGRMEPSIAWALNDTVGYSFWLGGLFKVM